MRVLAWKEIQLGDTQAVSNSMKQRLLLVALRS